MNNTLKWISFFASFCLVLIVIGMLFYFFFQLDQDFSTVPRTEQAIERKFSKEHAGWKNLKFDLIDPESAHGKIRSYVEKGYKILLNTHEELPNYAPHPINCTNCHFAGGNTTGGTGGGISLAGVAAQYPKYNAARNRVEDLAMRVNDCFRFSSNGKSLPLDSQEMLSIITYLHWISSDFPIYQSAPWLGVPPIKSKHQLNPEKGKEVYEAYCMDCHGKNGEGSIPSDKYPEVRIPPVWGPTSFNRQAGMGKIETLASFIYHNMPYEEPHINAEDALDVAAFILKQPRPDDSE